MTSRVAIYLKKWCFANTISVSIDRLFGPIARSSRLTKRILATSHERGKLSSQQRQHSLCLDVRALRQRQKEKTAGEREKKRNELGGKDRETYR